jgi:hypothetical protein
LEKIHRLREELEAEKKQGQRLKEGQSPIIESKSRGALPIMMPE